MTDSGNYGLTGTTSDPGFWMEWQFVEDGAECMSYNKISGRGIVGHNNEVFTDQTVEQCEALCCARDWCRSFDFLGMAGGVVCCVRSGSIALRTPLQGCGCRSRPPRSAVHVAVVCRAARA